MSNPHLHSVKSMDGFCSDSHIFVCDVGMHVCAYVWVDLNMRMHCPISMHLHVFTAEQIITIYMK